MISDKVQFINFFNLQKKQPKKTPKTTTQKKPKTK